jgi:hypothetical protein
MLTVRKLKNPPGRTAIRMATKELNPVKLSPFRTSQFILLAFLILCGLQLSALASVRNVQNCGATGNGSTDDTTAIKTCISQLVAGDTLEFPAGTYHVSSQLTVDVSNVIIDGSNNTAVIINKQTGQGPVFLVGKPGLEGSNVACSGSWPGIASGSALSATANETATSFSTTSALSGVGVGSYVLLLQGGEDSSEGSGNTGCDPSGCRAEFVKITGASGSTYTVDTMLHDTFNPSVNNAIACPINGVIQGVTLQNITLDGGSVNNWLAEFNSCAECTISGVTFRNALGSALLHTVDYNLTLSNITITGAGSDQCGSAEQGYANSNVTATGIAVSSLNPGTSGACLNGVGAFGLEEVDLVSSTLSNVTVNSAGTAGGRPMKLTASRYNTFDSLTVENGVGGFNGLSLEYYSSHNTFNSCTITNNGGSGTGNGNAGINTFGNFNQYNTFNNCKVTGNGNVQIYVSNFDAMRLGQDSNDTFNGITVGGSGTTGFLVEASNACLNNNVLAAGSGLNTGISVMNTTSQGSGNVLNGYSSNLASGTCGSSATAPAPPTGLTAVVQ